MDLKDSQLSIFLPWRWYYYCLYSGAKATRRGCGREYGVSVMAKYLIMNNS